MLARPRVGARPTSSRPALVIDAGHSWPRGRHVYPRGVLDIGWRDLASVFLEPASRPRRLPLPAPWGDDAIPLLSVRSGFDLLLSECDFPPGSEVLMSAVTIPDMARLVAHHDLVAVPVDLDPATLGPDPARLIAAITPRSRAIVVAHLFGSRAPLAPIADAARRHGLLLVEDAAQAFRGSTARGHPAIDIALTSFGPIKTATALGGAIMSVRDPDMLARLRARHATWPVAPDAALKRRARRMIAVKAAGRPAPFAVLAALCRVGGRTHDDLLAGALRGFSPESLLPQLRHRPSPALLALLARRLRQSHEARIARRVAHARAVIDATPAGRVPGATIPDHTHWVLPWRSRDPERLVRLLWRHGFDATRRGSSLFALPPPSDRPDLAPRCAQALVHDLVYLPAYPRMPPAALARLTALLRDDEPPHDADR